MLIKSEIIHKKILIENIFLFEIKKFSLNIEIIFYNPYLL